MAFDPDEYLQQKTAEMSAPAAQVAPTSPGFDPDAYLQSKSAAAPAAEPPGVLESFMRGFGHNAPSALPQKLVAGGEAALAKVTGQGGGKSLSDLYGGKEAQLNASADAAQAANPASYAAGSAVSGPLGIIKGAMSNSGVESFMRGAVQGATMGLGDEASGGAEALYDKVLGDDKGKSLGDLYSEHTAEARAENAAAQAAHPGLYGAGLLGGGIASSVGTAGLAPASVAGRLGVAAGMGAASGVGFGNADNITDGAKEALKGALVGGAVGAAGEGVGSYLASKAAPVADSLDSTADALTEKATGVTAAFKDKNFLPDGGTGRQIRDRGLMSFGDGPAQIADKAEAALAQSWKGIQDNVDTLADRGVTIDRNTVIDYIKDKITKLSQDESQNGLVQQLESRIKDIQSKLPGDAASVGADSAADSLGGEIPINQGESVKRGFMAKSNYMNPEATQADKIVASGYKQAVEDAATEADPTLAAQFKADKETYGALKPVVVGAGKRASTLQQSQYGGLLDTATDLATGGGMQGIVAAGARRAIAPRIASMAAVGADRLAEIVRSAPESLGAFAGQLTAAAQRGGVALAATNQILSQTSPEYREHMKRLFDGTQ